MLHKAPTFQGSVSTTARSTPSATIDQKTLSQSVLTPALTGTVSNTSNLVLIVVKGDSTPSWDAYAPEYVARSSDKAIEIKNGHWTMVPITGYRGYDFSNGDYSVGLYDGDSHALLTSGILKISMLPPVATCTLSITPPVVAVGGKVTVAWNSENATSASWGIDTPGGNDDILTQMDYAPTVTQGSKTVVIKDAGISPITLYVGGPGGAGSPCRASVTAH